MNNTFALSSLLLLTIGCGGGGPVTLEHLGLCKPQKQRPVLVIGSETVVLL